MPVLRYYSSTAQPTTLVGGVTAGSTTISVMATTGFPVSYPYTLALDFGAGTEELVDVTGAAGGTLTVTRGVDGTSAQSHSAGAVVRHVTSGRDSADYQNHQAATAAVHGVAGALVGTTDTQTLTNKALTSPTVTGTVAGSASYTSPTLTGLATVTGNMDVNGTAAGTAQLDVTGASGQTASLQRWLDNAGTTLASVTASGLVNGNRGADITAPSAAGVGVIVRGLASQTGNLQEWKTSGGATVASILPDGRMTNAAGITVTANAVDSIQFKGLTNATSQILFRLSTSTNALVLTGDDNGQVTVGNLVELTPAPWINYTPVWTASTTNPALGNGTLAGRWAQTGKTVYFEFQLVFGSSTNPGSGTYSFTLPVMTSATGDRTACGQASGAAGRCIAAAPIPASSTTVNVFAPSTTTSAVISALTNSGLMGSAWVSGNFIRINGTYEAA